MTATKTKKRTTKLIPKRTPSRPAQRLLAFARAKSRDCQTWPELHNDVYGVGAMAGQLFPTVSSRTAFAKTPEFREIAKLIEQLPGPGDQPPQALPSGKLLLRLPVSLHAALVKEAELEGISLNQLVVAKVAAQLRDVVRT